ncbi:cadmium-translocating P-type ATPase [Sandaracinobacter neustonicus]|uniref:Cadmium-translocating P-type ATPase n=1 Tax=Sandaracinobacter neustonicus TaxID=1715348 RepID=A0A501XDQ7_9SPHN|nr:heavy metal translocating P-type ATPase [Sandaracinobacter neustonicus]TPE58589.1 cadmium-translocating P-type ATPase [Sandaracinobacter neustonicus]
MATLAPSNLDLFTAEAAPGERRIDLHVPAIHCAGCIRKVEGAVRSLPGITKARVNFTTRRLTAEWADGSLDPGAILAAVEAAGFEARPFAPADVAAQGSDPASRRLIKAMAVAGFAAMNIMLLSVSVWSGADGATRDLFHLISAAIALPTIAYSGMPFFSSAWGALRQGRTNMDVPISIGLVLATALSLYETFTRGHEAWFDAAVMLLFFLLLGRVADSLMRDRARAGVAALLKQSAPGALVRAPSGDTEWRPIESVAPGMTVLVAAGERVPVDGLVLEGGSAIDRSLVTGESLPEAVGPGGQLLAGTLNLDGPLAMKATAVGEASFLAQVVRLMEDAEQGRARYTRIADRAARLYAPVVHLAALFTAIGWLIAGAGLYQALVTAIAVLIITCPCALGLAVPAVQVRAASVLMKRGLLVKDGSALERLAECDTLIFDKTGTLTLGRPTPVGVLPLSDADLALAAGLAAKSRHPLSRALLAAARAQGITPTPLAEVTEHPGLGLEAQVNGERLRLGRPDWAGADAADTHLLALAFRKGGQPAVLIPFEDPLRPDAAAAIARLKRDGFEIRILSGDREAPVRHAAQALGIAHWDAGLAPADKLAAIEALKAEGHKVLVVGDGLNDAPMLAGGHASIAPSSASDAGQTAADMLFLNDSLMAVPQAVETARRADSHVRQNFVMAIGYNILAVPIAMAGFATPLIAAVAMSLSSLIVVGNALRLKAPK